jgi:MoxR-like ATPase
MQELSIQRMEASDFAPKTDIKYLDVFELMSLYEGLSFRAPTIVVGPKGVGKTLSIQAYAAHIGCPIITFDCSEDVRRQHLIGMFILHGDRTPFVLGPLTTAFEIANEVGRCILVLEEINALTPQMQKVLNAPADWRQRIEVPEARKVFCLKPGCKVWISGTMNTAVYGGVYQLNEDLKSRFRLIPLGYPKPTEEKKIVQEVLSTSMLDTSVIDRVITLAHETRQQSLEYALSTRDVVQLLEDIADMDLKRALRIVLGKFDDTDRDTVVERVNSIFGVSFDTSRRRDRNRNGATAGTRR